MRPRRSARLRRGRPPLDEVHRPRHARDLARFTAAETGRPVEAIVYHATGNVIGVRAPGAFYRFLRGFGHPMVAAHQLFSEDTDPGQAARAWESWLARVLDPAS